MIKKILFLTLILHLGLTDAVAACTVTANNSNVSITDDGISVQYDCKKITDPGNVSEKSSLIEHGTKCYIYCKSNDEGWLLGAEGCTNGYKGSVKFHNSAEADARLYVPKLNGLFVKCEEDPDAPQQQEQENNNSVTITPSADPLDALIKKIEQQKKALIDKCFNGVEPK